LTPMMSARFDIGRSAGNGVMPDHDIVHYYTELAVGLMSLRRANGD